MEEIKECQICKALKESSPTPGGDEICPDCGDREMMDYEPRDDLEGCKSYWEFCKKTPTMKFTTRSVFWNIYRDFLLNEKKGGEMK